MNPNRTGYDGKRVKGQLWHKIVLSTYESDGPWRTPAHISAMIDRFTFGEVMTRKQEPSYIIMVKDDDDLASLSLALGIQDEEYRGQADWSLIKRNSKRTNFTPDRAARLGL